MYKPDRKNYESEYLRLADGDMHEVELVCIGEEKSTYEKGKERMEMVFHVLREWAHGGAEITYEPPKKFTTSALVFCDWVENALVSKQESMVVNIMYDERRKEWTIKPSSKQFTPDPAVVRGALKGGRR